MNADQTRDQNLVGAVAKETMPVTPVDAQPVEGLEPSNSNFKPPPGLEIIQSVPTPDLSGVAGTGAVQHPPKAASITGAGVTYPTGIEDQTAAEKLRGGKPDTGLTGEATVSYRQGIIYQIKQKLQKAA